MKGTRFGWTLVPALLSVLLLAACGGGSSSSSSGSGTTSDVTLSGSMSLPSAAAAVAVPGGDAAPAIVTLPTPSDYSLFCVTFTDPPHSGTGDFDASGNFSVTVSDAAGLPIGCFINEKTTNTPVATITFTVGDPSGFDDGSGDTATFAGGTYTITINFDPATGSASVDVRAVASTPPPPSATFGPADLVGEWSMRCADDNSAAGQEACYQFIPPRVFADVITGTATATGESVYAMGIWRSLAAYEDAGKTEGLDTSMIPAGEIDLASLATLYAATDPAAVVTTAFAKGPFGAASWAAVTTPDPHFVLSGDDLLAYLGTAGIPYDSTFDDTSGDACPAVPMDLSLQLHRQCLLQYLEYLERRVENVVPYSVAGIDPALYLPRTTDDAWNVFGSPADSAATGATLIPFKERVASPDIRARYAIMDLDLSGSTIVANDEEHYNYTYDPGGGPISCDSFHKTVISFTPSASDATAMVGWFTVSEGDSCDPSRAFTATFKVIFTPLDTTPTLTPATMVGHYYSACQPQAGGGTLGSHSSILTLTDGGSTAGAAVTDFSYANGRCEDSPASVMDMTVTLTPLVDRPTGWSTTDSATLFEVSITSQMLTLIDPALVTQYNADGAYGTLAGGSDWVLGTPRDVTGVRYDGSSEPTNVYDLLYKDADGVIYQGIENRVSVYGVADDVAPRFVPATASTLDMAALDGRSFAANCQQDIRPDYNANSRSQTFTFDNTAGTVTVVETYHNDTACDFAARTVEEVQVIPIADDSPVGGQPFTNRGFASPMMADTSLAGYSRTVSVYDATAAANMNAAYAGSGVYGYNTWADTSRDIDRTGFAEDGSADPGGAFPVSASLLLGKYLFLGTPEGADPVNADGYPIAIHNNDPGFEVDTALTIADLDGSWVTECRDESSGTPASSFDAIAIDGATGAVTVSSWSFATSDCTGTATPNPGPGAITIDSIDGTVDLGGRGTAFQASLTEGGVKTCGILQLTADMLWSKSIPEPGGDGSCAGDYPAAFNPADGPASRNITPVTAATMPIASFASGCRDNGTSPDEQEFLQVFGDKVVVQAVQFLSSTGGVCTGNASESDMFAMSLVYGSEVSTIRGNATLMDATDPYSSMTQKQMLHLEGQSHLYVGDDSGPLDAAGYPTEYGDYPFMRDF